MNTGQELRPCKACGQPEGHIGANGGWLWGECWNCDYRTSFHRSAEEAQEEWNRRSSDEQAEVVGWRDLLTEAREWVELAPALPGLDPADEHLVRDLLKRIDAYLLASHPAVAAGGVTEERVEAAAREFLLHKGETPWRVTRRGAELWEDYAPAMRAALTAALAAPLPTPPSRGEGV